MRRALGLVVLAGVLLAAIGGARAESVLDRIKRTGVLEAATRADAVPFAFRDSTGAFKGLSVDLLEQIRKRLASKLDRPVKMTLHEVTTANRFSLVENGTVAIECGIATPTWARERRVDFSIPFFENGTRILAFRAAAKTVDDMHGKRVGVLQGSTTAQILRSTVPTATPVEVPDMNTGLAMMMAGKIDGLANIGVVLRGLINSSDAKSRLVMLPRTGALSYESMACALPQDDSPWRDFVDHTLADLLVGVDQFRGTYFDIYERWFGPQGMLFYPLDREVAQRLAGSLIWLN